MKKFLTLFIACLAMSVSAQSVRLKYQNTVLAPNDTIVVSYTSDELLFEKNVYLGYQNLTNSDMTFMVCKTEIESARSNEIYFCLDECYSGDCSGEISLSANQEIDENSESALHVAFTPGVEGPAVYSFTFQNTNNPDDACTVYILFMTSTGISQATSNNQFKAYPNPATTNVTIEYDASMAAGSYVVVKNITGCEVFKSPASSVGKTTVNTSDLKAGFYFYGLEDAKGKMICTKKLMIK